VTLVNEYVNI